MRQGDYELCIVNGIEVPDEWEVHLRHGQVYQLALTNHANTRCNVEIRIDGKDVGTWRISAAKTILLERPADQEGCFTFFRLGSPEAITTGVPATEKTGWVEANFIPEARKKGSLDLGNYLYAANPMALGAAEPEALDAGGTALTGKSDQAYGDADDIFQFDFQAMEQIELLLKCESEPGEDDEPFNLQPQEPPIATFERVTFTVFDCPDCAKPSRVPTGSGHIRIKCPACSCQFIRRT